MPNPTPSLADTDRPGERNLLLARAPLLVLCAAGALVYWRFLVGFAPSGDDIVLQYIPYQELIRRSLRLGQWPMWNPMTFCGRPLMADIQVGVLYPPNWLHWILPLPISFTILFLAHTAWNLAGSYRLGRAWKLSPPACALMAVLYAFAGFFTVKLQTGIVLFHYVAAWLPWEALALTALMHAPSPRRSALFALTLAMSLLAGSPQLTFYSWIVLAGLALILSLDGAEATAPAKRFQGLLFAGAALVLALTLTAAQTFQTYHMAKVSFDRGDAASWDYVTEGSLDPRLMGLLVNPGLFGPGDREEVYWGPESFSEADSYMTLWSWLFLAPVGIALFISKRGGESPGNRLQRKLFFAGLALAAVGLILAPGLHSPIFRFFYDYVPGFNRFRVPSRLIFWFTVGISVSAGAAFDRWLAASAEARDGKSPSIFVGLLTSAGVALLFALFVGRHQVWTWLECPILKIADPRLRDAAQYELTTHLFSQVLRGAVFTALAGAALIACKRSATMKPPNFAGGYLPWALPALAALELALAAWPNQKTTRIGEFEAVSYPNSPLVSKIKELSRGGRILWMNTLIDWQLDQNQPEVVRNALIMQNLQDARGYDPVNAKWIGEWMNQLSGLNPTHNPRGMMDVERIVHPSWLTLMGVDLVLDYTDLSSVPGLKLAGFIGFKEGSLGIWRNENFQGLAFAVPFGGTAPDWSAAQQAQANATADGRPLPPIFFDEQILSGKLQLAKEVGPDFKVSPVEEGPNRFRYETDFPQPAALLFAQSAYRGWRAWIIDGDSRREWIIGGETPVVTAGGTFLAVAVGAGQHEVTFEYAPPEGFQWAVAASLAALLALAIFLFSNFRKRAKSFRGVNTTLEPRSGEGT